MHCGEVATKVLHQKISEELNGSAVEAFWAGTSFLLCSAGRMCPRVHKQNEESTWPLLIPSLVFQPVIGTLSEVLGRKIMVLIAILFFFVGALLAGLARNFVHLLVGRSLQGLGGGGIITLCGIVTADIVPLSHRAKYFGIYSGMWSLGSVLGPVLGGCFVERATWVSHNPYLCIRHSITTCAKIRFFVSGGYSILIFPSSE
jgi:MFS family permease